MESNPYNYKMVPGKGAELTYPFALVQLRILRRLAETDGLLTGAEKAEIDRLEAKVLTLLKGGYVGTPKRATNF